MKITKRQLNRIIAEETQKLNEAPAYRMKEYERKKNQTLQQLMNSIRSQITFIEGQLLMGSFDYEDMFDWDFGHIAGLADTIDAAREKAAEEGVPFTEPDTSRIAEYQHRGRPAVVSRWSMNESTSKPNKMKITKRQLQGIIKEELGLIRENAEDEGDAVDAEVAQIVSNMQQVLRSYDPEESTVDDVMEVGKLAARFDYLHDIYFKGVGTMKEYNKKFGPLPLVTDPRLT